jgi:hypothetical protein
MSIDNEQSKWLILKEGQEIGPLDFYEVIRLIKQSKVHSMDFIKRTTDRSWFQVADITDFQLHKFKSLADSVLGDRIPLSNRRRHDRFKVDEKILINHQNTNVWAEVSELGSGGVGVETIYGLLGLSDTLKINIQYHGMSINALAKVVSKRDWKNPSDNTFVFRYGLKFVKFDSKSEILLSKILKSLKSNSQAAA